MKKKILSAMVAAGMLTMASSGVLALAPTTVAEPDTFGDSLINLPVDESTVTTSTADVWFVKINEAYAYSIDLVGAGKSGDMAQACDNVGANTHRTLSYRTIILASDLTCDETTNSPGLIGDNTSPVTVFNPALRVCNWKSPILKDGQYALAINPIVLGGNAAALPGTPTNGSIQEIRLADTTASAVASCENMDVVVGGLVFPSVNGVDADDTIPYTSNSFRNMSVDADDNAGGGAADGILDGDGHYQVFRIASAAADPTVVPNAPEPLSPIAFGSSVPSYSTLTGFSFLDDSGTDGAASWYELFIWDKNKKRITSYGSYSSSPNWYKLGVDSQLQCNLATTATSSRLCTLSNLGAPAAEPFDTPAFTAELATYNVNDEFTWWVRGYNALGYSTWSSAPGVFVK